jgi:hypothetical protein
LKIGIAKTQAKDFGITLNGETDGSELYYMTFCKRGRAKVAFLIETDSYYSSIFLFQNVESVNDHLGCQEEIEFVALSDSSVRARVQSIVSKAKSLIGDYYSDFQQFQEVLNGIPWKFLDYQTPECLKKSGT